MAPASKAIARGAASLVAAALLSACSATSPTTRAAPRPTSGDTVLVPWRPGHATAFQIGAAEEHRVSAAQGLLPVKIYRPDGEGPLPAIVLLHGCGGLHGE